MATKISHSPLELTGLAPHPIESWHKLQDFLQLHEEQVQCMRRTSETLLREAGDFVVATYDYLSKFDETAAVLGWEQEMDEEHLQERRQFFSTWLARTIGVDLSDEFAWYLFRAGKYHAGHGPRQIHTPDMWVLASVSVVQAYFAQRILAESRDAALNAAAIAGWNKYLMLQAYQMLAGYQVARRLEEGTVAVEVKLYGRLQGLVGEERRTIRVCPQSTVADALRKYLDYHPVLVEEFFQLQWRSPQDDGTATWTTDFERVLVPREGPYWRIVLNGRDIQYGQGMDSPLQEGDVLGLFPPGR